jgi:hypothetical protein
MSFRGTLLVLSLVPGRRLEQESARAPRASSPTREPRQAGAARTTIPFVQLDRARRMPGPVPGPLQVAARGNVQAMLWGPPSMVTTLRSLSRAGSRAAVASTL